MTTVELRTLVDKALLLEGYDLVEEGWTVVVSTPPPDFPEVGLVAFVHSSGKCVRLAVAVHGLPPSDLVR